jgi:integrase
MPQKSDDTVHILEGQATLFQRPTSPVWHVRYKAHGKWERQTTKCEDLSAAKQKATDIVVDARFKEKHSLPIVNKRVKSVAKLTIRRLEALIDSGRGKATYKTYIQAIEKYVIPLLGNHNIDKIDNAVLAKFEKQRIDLMGRTPSASVINNHNSALNQVFDEALERGYMTKFQVPLLRNDGIKTERRPDFTLDEYKLLYKKMRVWEREARKGNETLLRGVLRDYILVLANTGIRAGTEAMNLKWKNISHFEEKGVKYIALHVNGKTGQREVIARHSTAYYLNRLRCRTEAWAEGSFEDFLKKRKDEYVFRVDGKDMTGAFGKMFARLAVLFSFERKCKLRTSTAPSGY